MSRKRKTTVLLILLLLLTVLGFIWGNSFDNIPESQQKSQIVRAIVEPILEPFVGEGNVTDYLVRKLAHFSEFALLGGVLAGLLILCRRVRLQPLVNCLFIGLCAAVADETIQIFTGRGSQVSDVLLDFCGVAAGLVLVLTLYGIIAAIQKKGSN